LQCSFSPLKFHETIASNLPYILPNGGLCIHQFSKRIAEITRIPGKFISLDFLPGEYRLNVSIRDQVPVRRWTRNFAIGSPG
jgi:hypothetical protein